ncbi:MAG: SDR family oxidoreductase [Nitratireductor sp.]
MSNVVIVTGGSRGIGAAAALLAAEAGNVVCVNYVSNAVAADALVSVIEAKGGKAFAVQGDVASNDEVIALFKEADKHGTLVGLVNNAGIVDVKARVDEFSVDRLSRMMNVNILGSFYCAREACLRMSTKHGGKGGSIVNLTSAAATLGAGGQYVDYAASKGAIDTFTVGFAREVAEEGVRVNGVRPGIIDTELHASGGEPDRVEQMISSVPMKRAGTAMDVAQAISWLLSDASSYVTGTTIDVTGGR